MMVMPGLVTIWMNRNMVLTTYGTGDDDHRRAAPHDPSPVEGDWYEAYGPISDAIYNAMKEQL
jgi:hypothetical protein